MDTINFVQTLERELRARDARRKALHSNLSAEVMDAALRCGQEYRAIAVQLALRQLGLRLKRHLRSLTRLLQQRHRHPANQP